MHAQVEAGELQQQVLAPAVQRQQALALDAVDRQAAVADHLAHDMPDELVGFLAQDDQGGTFRHGASVPRAGSWRRGRTPVAYTSRMNAASDADPALQALWLPFVDGALAWPGRALFLGARDGWPLHQRPWPGLACVQAFRPAFDALQRSGLDVAPAPAPDARWPLVLLLPPRQREAARAQFAQALWLLEPGGRVVAAMPNAEGAKSGEGDLARLAGPLEVISKHMCRVFWTAPLDGPADAGLADAWRDGAAVRPLDLTVAGYPVHSRPGMFAWDRVDRASALLAAHLPSDLAGEGADLGAGWGYLSMEVLARNPGVRALDLYEADADALELARGNLRPFSGNARLDFHWHDVATGLPRRYDFIVTNPPFHALGRADRPDLGRAFLSSAADALAAGGRLWLVANRHLPYESVLDARFSSVRTVVQADGFKVVEARR